METVRLKPYLRIEHIVSLLLLLCLLTARGQSDAEEIYNRATNQLLSQDLELSIEIKEINKNGRIKENAFNVLIAKFGQVEKTLNIVQKPERARGITILLTDYPDRLGQIEIFTPANGKVRKLKATQKNMAMIGAGLSISNYASRKQNVSFSLLGKETRNGRSHFKILIEDSSDPYTDTAVFFIEEGTYRIVEIAYLGENGKRKSINKFSDFISLDEPQGKIQARHISYQDFESKKKSEIRILKIRSRPDLKEEDFDIQQMAN
ncbi:MAG: outer membrane lipoprotein-sorting protein [Flavobacteriaceae bacterium]